MPKTTTIKANCRYCEAEYQAESFPLPWGMKPLIWEFCSDECQQGHIADTNKAEHDRDEFDRKRDAVRLWESIVPINMRETDLTRLPKIKKHIDWRPDDTGRGLIIVGKTGSGKTRLSYLMLKNLMIEVGLSVMYFRPGDFALKSHSAWMNNRSEQFYAEILKADLVIWDDLGKEKFTETRMMDFFAAVNNRLDNLQPMIFTTNYYGAELAGRFTDKDFSEPFIRRIRESTETINLK